MATVLTGKEHGDGKDRVRNVALDWVPWILGQEQMCFGRFA